MIQRIQTLWLLLAAGCSTASFFFPFYTGNKDNNLFIELNAQSHFLLLLLCVAVILSTVLSVFFYKNRKKQMLIVLSGLIIQILNIIYFFLQTKNFKEGTVSLTAVFSFAVPVFLILAWIAIRKDEKLVQSMDRLR
jgi:predicted PurR-regulated permease PerM